LYHNSIRMNRSLKFSVACSNLATVAGQIPAEDILVYGTPNPGCRALVVWAFGTCANWVIARIMPEQKVRLRVALDVDRRDVYRIGAQDEVVFILEAASKRDGSRIAAGFCTGRQPTRRGFLHVRPQWTDG
jgi:hypothetical protein